MNTTRIYMKHFIDAYSDIYTKLYEYYTPDKIYNRTVWNLMMDYGSDSWKSNCEFAKLFVVIFGNVPTSDRELVTFGLTRMYMDMIEKIGIAYASEFDTDDYIDGILQLK